MADLVATLSSIPTPTASARSSARCFRWIVRPAELLRVCLEGDSRLRLTDDARHALTELARAPAPRAQPLAATLSSDAELWRDRRGRNWIVIAREHAPLARALAQTIELEVLDGPAGSVAVAALGADAVPIAELVALLELRLGGSPR